MMDTSAESLIIAMNSLPMAGNHDTNRLRQHDAAHHQAFGHAQCLGGLALATRHGLDTSAEDLRHIGAVVEAKGDDSGR